MYFKWIIVSEIEFKFIIENKYKKLIAYLELSNKSIVRVLNDNIILGNCYYF